jgi:hypothetical protein
VSVIGKERKYVERNITSPTIEGRKDENNANEIRSEQTVQNSASLLGCKEAL